jgi:RNA polymerase sigma-70 factor (ECF subfamily)
MTLEEIYNQHAGFAWQTLRQMGLDETDAEDAMQEVFLTVHRALGDFEGRSSLRTWLFTICRSVARDRRGRAHRRREVSDDERLAGQVDDLTDVGRAVEHRQQVALLQAILDRMDAGQREVFLLFELQGLTGEAIAETLSLPLGTVYSRLRLGRAAFQAAVARLEAGESFRQRKAEAQQP